MTTEPERVTETWTCAGVRVTSAGKRAYAWITPDGQGVMFPEPRVIYATGSRYTVSVVHRDGDGLTMYGTPQWEGKPVVAAETVAGWRAAEVSAVTALKLAALERDEKRKDALDDALAPLVAISKTKRSGPDRDAFVAYVLRALQMPW